jgi:hypothetical protein
MRMIDVRSVFYLLFYLSAVSFSFSPSRKLSFGVTARTVRDRLPSPLLHLASSKDDISQSVSKEEEIARLQEQIRRLQEESAQEDVATTETELASKAGLVDKRAAELERVRGKEMPFSEGDLIDANIIPADGSSSGLGSVLPTILLAVGALVFFVAFSQVPIGQEDFARYSVAPPTQTIDLGDLNSDRKSS